MVIIVIFWAAVAALALKLVGNLLLPYRVLRMSGDEGISLGLGLLADLLLFFCIVGLAWGISNPGFFYEVKNAALVAGGAIVATYFHYFGVLSLVSLWGNRGGEDKK